MPPKATNCNQASQECQQRSLDGLTSVHLLNMAIVIACAMKRCEAGKVCIESKRPAEVDVVIVR